MKNKIKKFWNDNDVEILLVGTGIFVGVMSVILLKDAKELFKRHSIPIPDDSVTISDVMIDELGNQYFTITKNY